MFDYLFVASNAPAHSLVHKIQAATLAGRKPLLVYLRRPDEFLALDVPEHLAVEEFAVGFRGVGLRRLFSIVRLVWWLRRSIMPKVAKAADCYSETFDMLAVTMLAGIGRALKFRYEARDLHAIQFGRGPLSILTRAAERLTIPRLHTLIVTSEKFWYDYYQRYSPRRWVVVENMPRRSIWEGFGKRANGGPFRVGFVGVLRYYSCLCALVDAVRMLRREGVAVVVRFAGGGDVVQQLRTYCADEPAFEFTGAFKYSSEVQDLYCDLDLIYSVYDASLDNVRYAMPNKFYESFITHIPIMVASGTYLEQRVIEAGIGTGVPCTSAPAIKEALRQAVENRGWYQSARKHLDRMSASDLFEQHEATVTDAVVLA